MRKIGESHPYTPHNWGSRVHNGSPLIYAIHRVATTADDSGCTVGVCSHNSPQYRTIYTMLTYYAHCTYAYIIPCSHNTPRIWGLSKPCQYPLGNTPRNWGSRGQNGSGQKVGIVWGAGKNRGFFVPKIIFFWGGHFLGFFVTAWGKIGRKIKNLWERGRQPLPPTPSPRCNHVLVTAGDTVYEIVDGVVYHMMIILAQREF